jgi:hypothetical protein
MAISISLIMFENILAIFNALYTKGQCALFIFNIDIKPYSKKQYLVYIVTFFNNTT